MSTGRLLLLLFRLWDDGFEDQVASLWCMMRLLAGRGLTTWVLNEIRTLEFVLVIRFWSDQVGLKI